MSRRTTGEGTRDDARVLDRARCESLARRIYGFARGDSETRVRILSWWNGELRWARNRVTLASDRRDIRVEITRRDPRTNGRGRVVTNQLDDRSLDAAVRAAERVARLDEGPHATPFDLAPPGLDRPSAEIWSDATYGLTAEARGAVAQGIIAQAEAKGMLSAGYLEVRAGALASLSSLRPPGERALWDTPPTAWTQAQCSMTVRDPQGAGSGWAGLSSHDWGRIDAAALATRALEKCIASQHPVALEPGRYTVILEPQAVADLVEVLAAVDRIPNDPLQRELPEGGAPSPWRHAPDPELKLWRTKLGQKVVDERITISHDPADPALAIFPEPGMEPVTWIDHGVLTTLEHNRGYALEKLNENTGARGMIAYRMSGGDATMEEMIRTTRRGLLVTRFSDVNTVDASTLLATGLTRDGLWLVENGKITKAVKNFRFTESPLFVLNNLDALGEPVPVFRPVRNPYEPGTPLTPAIVPPLKARDFSFTSTIDAI